MHTALHSILQPLRTNHHSPLSHPTSYSSNPTQPLVIHTPSDISSLCCGSFHWLAWPLCTPGCPSLLLPVRWWPWDTVMICCGAVESISTVADKDINIPYSQIYNSVASFHVTELKVGDRRRLNEEGREGAKEWKDLLHGQELQCYRVKSKGQYFCLRMSPITPSPSLATAHK